MQGRRESGASRRRPLVAGVLAVLVLGVTLALVSTSSGGTGTSAAKPLIVSGGKGFGEVYAAKASTLKQALFKASLLPANRMTRNIALAGLGRADRKVNYNLALQCWKNNGCSTGTGGKLTVAYIEQFGENVFRQMSKMEFILQALTYPQVGKIIYKSAHSDLNPGRDEGGDPGCVVRLGLCDRAGHELPDGRRRGHLQARQGLRADHEHAGQVGQHRVPRRLPRESAVAQLAEV